MRPLKFKKCAMCQEEKSINLYTRNYRNKDHLESYCKSCRSQKKKSAYRCKLAKAYGITIQDYNKMLLEQGGRCAICSSDDPRGRGSNFHIDHCHRTNIVRALLCANCNTAIGLFFEKIENLKSAILYLEKHQQKENVLEFNPSQGLQ